MRLRNTSDIPDSLVREIIRFVKPAKVTRFDVKVRSVKRLSFSGRAHASHNATGLPTIVCSMPERLRSLPYTRKAFRAYLDITVYSRTELLVYLIAHELRHLWQSLVKRGWRYYGSKGQYSERDADCYALHMLREWRRK